MLAIGGYFLTTKVILNKDTVSNKQNETSQTKNGEKVTTPNKDKQPDKITPPTPQKNNIQNIKLDKVKVNTTLKNDPLGFIFLIFTDFLAQQDKGYDMVENTISDFDLVTWDSSLNYAICTIKYIKVDGQNIIKSIVFTKK